jgi:hypothetical protein
MGEGEGGDEAREEQSEDDEDDAENDHDDCLVSVQMFGRRVAGSVPCDRERPGIPGATGTGICRLIACQVGDIRRVG